MSSKRTRRWLGLGASGAIAALALSACAVLPFLPDDSSLSTPPPVSGGSTPGALPSGADPALAKFYTQRLTWTACSGGECSKLEVPIDYAKPTGATITLAVLRVPAKNQAQRIGSLVVNPGGPGASGVDYARYANQIVGAEVRRRFDVVGFDPRGTGGSAKAVKCFDATQMDNFLAIDPTPDNAAEEQALVDGGKDFATACQATNNPLLAHISTPEAARDMDVLRSALGDKKLNYLGKSYGTFLGATYIDLFPANVGQMVLDGVLPPDLTSKELSLGQAGGFEAATRSYVQNCVSRSSCVLGSTVDQGMQWIKDFMASVNTNPPKVTSDARVTSLDEGWAFTGIAAAMYDQALWPTLTSALKQASTGDGNGLMDLADQYADRTSAGTYSSHMLEAFFAISCIDRPDKSTPAQIDATVPEFEKVAPLWGKSFAFGNMSCNDWPYASATPPHKITGAGAGPVVVVGTTRDPATPYEWTKRLRAQMTNSVMISYDGDGHTAYRRSNNCVDSAIDAYYVNQTVPKDGLSC